MNQRSKIGPTADEKAIWRCNSSEYNNRYTTFSLNQQNAAKPPAVRLVDNRETFRTGEEMFNNSSYMTDYAQKPTTAPIRIKRNMGPSSIAARPEAKMECYSSYKSYFDKKNAKPAKSVKPPPPQGLGWKSNEKDTSLASVSMNCYRPYTAGEVQASQRHPIIISPEYGTIDINPDTRPSMAFQTTVQKNFVKHEGSFRPAPAPGAIKTPAHGIAGIAGADINAKMDLTTTHRDVFHDKNQAVSKDIDEAVPPLAKDKSAKTPKWYKSIEVGNNPDNDMSTQRSDYIHHSEVSRPKSFKPVLQYHSPDTKFEVSTLYKQAFTVHGNQRRKPMVPAIRTKDDEIIRHVMSKEAIYDTEYDRTYEKAPHTFIRPRAIVPKTSNRTKGRFYGNTSYSANFHCDNDRHIPRMPSFKPKKVSDPWHKSISGDADHFKSTTREHYMGEFAKPASICRPKIKKEQGITDGEGEARFDTEYSNCFDAPKAVVAV